MHTSPRLKAALGIAGSFVLLAGCSQNLTENAFEDALEREVETDEGTFTTGNELPEGWPADVPMVPEAEVLFAGTVDVETGDDSMEVTLVTEMSENEVWDYFIESLAANGWETQAVMRSPGANVLSATKDGSVLSILIAGDEGQTTITMGIGAGEEADEL